MKASEVYKEIRTAIEPWCKENGLNRLRQSIKAWHKPLGDRTLILWFETNKYGWSESLGSSFYVEFQLAKTEDIGAFGKGTFRKRLSYFFSDEERPHLWQVRNNVVAKLPLINEDNELYSLKELDMANEIRDFDMKGDFWFRYYDAEDVRAWMKVILPILDRSLHQIESLAKDGWLQ